jgi:hypothetical protein
MFYNKKKIIIIVVILLIVIFIILLNKRNSKNESIDRVFNGNSEVLEIEAELNSKIKNAFSEVEESYESGVKSYSDYTRSDFYNETRLNKNMTSGELSFVDTNDIDTENLYDTLGNKQENLPSTKVNNKEVDISNSNIIEAENYYLLRCTSSSIYTYYYIIKITSSGTLELTWYCYTENEIIDDDLINNDLEDDLSNYDLDNN